MVTRTKGSTWSMYDNLGIVNLEDYTSAGSDATSNINAILAEGLQLFIPPRAFFIGALDIPAGSVIMGAGINSILKLRDTANAPALTVGSDTVLENFTISGNKQNQVGTEVHALKLFNATKSTLRRMRVVDSKGDGISISGSTIDDLVLDCVTVTGYAENGIRIAAGINVSIISPRIYSSDSVATGDAIALVSDGAAISGVSIVNPVCRDVTGRGIAVIGNGSKNVTDVTISNARIHNNVSSGVHLINAERVLLSDSILASNGIDGLRLEGDVQNVRAVNLIAKNNAQFGAREVVAGSTPNNNGFVYVLTSGNGTNVVTKVGANSFIT